MKPGQARIGQTVATLREFQNWPEIPVGTLAEIRGICGQYKGAETDAIAIHPHVKDFGLIVCVSADVELVRQ